jgi:hypothetical protein
VASVQSLQSGELLKRQKVCNITATTAFPAMQIQYVGSCLFAKITVAAGGDITIHADDVDGATTTYCTIDLSTPAAAVDTYGELEDVINGYEDLRCFLIGVLPSQSTDNTLDTLASTSIRTTNGLTLYSDEALLDVGFAITNRKFTSRPSGGWATKDAGWVKDDLCVNSLHYLSMAVTAAGTGNIEVYGVSEDGDTTVLLWDNAIADATGGVTEEHGATPTPDTVFVAAPRGHRLVVWFDMVAAITAIALNAVGYTKHLTGEEVPDANYTGLT